MRPIYFIALMPLLVSCNYPKQGSSPNDSIVIPRDAGVRYADRQPKLIDSIQRDTIQLKPDTTKKLLEYQIDHTFSDASSKDHFSITLYGGDLVKSVVVFKISTPTGKELFKQTLTGTDLLDDMEDILTVKQKQDTIRSKMLHFFDEHSFLKPAIDPRQTFDDAFSFASASEQADWLAIKADRTAVGFSYYYGYESSSVIAYSKKKKKVMEVFYSD